MKDLANLLPFPLPVFLLLLDRLKHINIEHG